MFSHTQAVKWSRDVHAIRERAFHSRTETWSRDIPKDSSDHWACDGFHTTPVKIRRWFQIDKQIDGPERHDGIYEVACGIRGRILLDGNTYK